MCCHFSRPNNIYSKASSWKRKSKRKLLFIIHKDSRIVLTYGFKMYIRAIVFYFTTKNIKNCGFLNVELIISSQNYKLLNGNVTKSLKIYFSLIIIIFIISYSF